MYMDIGFIPADSGDRSDRAAVSRRQIAKSFCQPAANSAKEKVIERMRYLPKWHTDKGRIFAFQILNTAKNEKNDEYR